MRHFKRAKMTAKAKDAVETYAAVHGIAISDVRTDRPAIMGIYAELEERGYIWQADKQAWAYIPPKASETTPEGVMFLVAAQHDFETVMYIVKEGLKAAGFQVLSETAIIRSGFEPSEAILEVRL